MKKIGNVLRKYGFYLATGIICVGALIAIFLMPNKEGNVKNEANPYAKNELTDARDINEMTEDEMNIVDEDDLDKTDESNQDMEVEDQTTLDQSAILDNSTSEDITLETTQEPDSIVTDQNKTEDVVTTEDTANDIVSTQDHTNEVTENETNEVAQEPEEKEVQTETFESTTASTNTEPFFAEGDTFAWPVEGSVVVPYTDESTKHWFSESLNQTMRTFGICISAPEGTEVKAVAKGRVMEIVNDSSEYLEAGMPYVGKLMVLDHGNGYMSVYGFQDGTVNEELVGQVVNTGDVLGTVGSPKGAFISLGDNIYLQVTHNDKVVNPLNYLSVDTDVEKAEGVDLGFAE